MRSDGHDVYLKDFTGVIERPVVAIFRHRSPLVLSPVNRIISISEEEKLTHQVVKACPLCQKPTYLDGGCNYMKCSNSDPPSNCPTEWCFLCHKIKYRPLTIKPYDSCCNDPRHNSH